MTEDTPSERAFADHDAFERRNGAFAAARTPFDAEATAAGDPPEFEVTVRLPTLSAAVDGEVGDAVADGWYETLALRLEDAYDVARAADGEVGVERDRSTGTVRVELSFSVADPRRGVDDAAALVDYVEGTYVQGVIPGYDYDDPVAGLLSRARRKGRGEADRPESDEPRDPRR